MYYIMQSNRISFDFKIIDRFIVQEIDIFLKFKKTNY